jgi:hypothetical protein
MDNGKNGPEVGACDHFQPGDLAKLSEDFLKSKGVPEAVWEGCRFGHGGGGGSGPFKSVYMEVERRSGNWVAVKLDRRKVDMAPEERGFRVVHLSEGASGAIAPA